MVIESLINPFRAEKTPWALFFIGVLYSSIAVFLSNWIFREQASMLVVFLIVMACIPLLYRTLKFEEKKNVSMQGGETKLLKEHSKALSFLIFLFLGCTASLVFWYVVLPAFTGVDPSPPPGRALGPVAFAASPHWGFAGDRRASGAPLPLGIPSPHWGEG